jgi:hypothetical protein
MDTTDPGCALVDRALAKTRIAAAHFRQSLSVLDRLRRDPDPDAVQMTVALMANKLYWDALNRELEAAMEALRPYETLDGGCLHYRQLEIGPSPYPFETASRPEPGSAPDPVQVAEAVH